MQSVQTEGSAFDGRAKLRTSLEGFRVGMLVSIGDQGTPHARPMYVVSDTTSDDLFFMTDAGSMKVIDINTNPRVLLAFCSESSNRYVTVSGVASAEKDPARAKSLWNLQTQAWWPDGPGDPNLLILRVRPEDVEYWDGPSKISYSLSLVSALVTGKRIEPHGDHGTVHIPGAHLG